MIIFRDFSCIQINSYTHNHLISISETLKLFIVCLESINLRPSRGTFMSKITKILDLYHQEVQALICFVASSSTILFV